PCPQAAPPAHVPPNPGSSRDPLARFITQVYRDLLGRAPTKTEISYFHSLLKSGALTRDQVVLPILSSPEYRTSLVNQFYKDVLNRNPTAAELAAGKKTVKSTSGEQLKANLMGSAEYFFGRAGVTEYFDNPRVRLSKNRVRVKMLRKATFELLVERVKG